MTEEDVQLPTRKRRTLWLALGAALLLLAVLLIPPFISISQYKSSITQLMSRSLGRPVRLSSVEMRLLPWPGFVLSDLTVDEDPAYGAEPILHANTVKASIRLLSLWRGRLEIDSISVDEASLNVVRTPQGTWNLDSLFHTAASHVQPAKDSLPAVRSVRLPYLEATNSRINMKNGMEKLPFSLVNADLSFWQEKPGVWRLRLRGQPARTDVTLDLADTGIVRVEASLYSASELHQIPIRLDLQWREAQLGQLSRLLIGADPGWRGDLTGQLHLEGTPDAAKVTTRLSASGVHRAEFAPADPLDFDANCSFLYHYSSRTVENLSCDSPLGDGHMHLEGSLPGDAPPRLTLNLDRISTQAGLDLLRTVRRGIPDDLAAHGSITGKLNYDPLVLTPVPQPIENHIRNSKKKTKPLPLPLTGSLQVAGLELSGGPLDQPLRFSNFKLQPVTDEDPQPAALDAEDSVAAGGTIPLSITARISHAHYALSLHGPVSFKRLREFAQLTGVADHVSFKQLSGEAPTLDLSAEGTWIPLEESPLDASTYQGGGFTGPEDISAISNVPLPILPKPSSFLTGTITIRKAVWNTDALANSVAIETATLHLDSSGPRWEGDFTYGPVKGRAIFTLPVQCEQVKPCMPRLNLTFEELDAGVVQTALLGASDKKTLLSSLIARISPASHPVWPELGAAVNVGTLILGPVKLQKVTAGLAIHSDSAQLNALDATFFGGSLHLTGTATNGLQPTYELSGTLAKADPKALCGFFDLSCGGGPMDVSGKVALAGYTAKDLSTSAAGTIHLDWANGTMKGYPSPHSNSATATPLPPSLARFSRWTADASIGKSSVAFGNSYVPIGRKRASVPFTITFGEPPKVFFPTVNTSLKH